MRALFTLTLSFPAILCPHCKNVQYLQLCVLITLKTPMQVKLTKNMVYAIECVFAACCEVSRWRAGGGARRQEATFQSVCSAISTPTPPLIIHKYKIQNSKIQKYKNTKIQKHKNTPPLLTHKYNANMLSDTYTYIQKAMQKYKITQFKMNTSHKEKNVEC